MKPDSTKYNNNPEYIRELIDRAGLSPLKAGRAIGLSERAIQYYLSGSRTFLYPVQYALESLPKKR